MLLWTLLPSMHQDNFGYLCMIIQPALKEDAGWYTVSAKNEAGIVSSTARLDIHSELVTCTNTQGLKRNPLLRWSIKGFFERGPDQTKESRVRARVVIFDKSVCMCRYRAASDPANSSELPLCTQLCFCNEHSSLRCVFATNNISNNCNLPSKLLLLIWVCYLRLNQHRPDSFRSLLLCNL